MNVNHKWQMKLIRHFMYKRYVPYARLVEEKKAQGLWGNTWGVKVDENDPDEGVKFELVGCPLAAKRSREQFSICVPIKNTENISYNCIFFSNKTLTFL